MVATPNVTTPPSAITTDEEHLAVLAEIRRLIGLDPAPTTPEGQRLESLAKLAQTYEAQRWPHGHHRGAT